MAKHASNRIPERLLVNKGDDSMQTKDSKNVFGDLSSSRLPSQ